MLLCTKTHFIKSLEKRLAGEEGHGDQEERTRTGAEMKQRIKDYSTDATGLNPGSEVWYWRASRPAKERRVTRTDDPPTQSAVSADRDRAHHHRDRVRQEKGTFSRFVEGKSPKKGQHLVYVDGGFDLFSSGHIEFLGNVVKAETEVARQAGWFTEEAKQQRIQESGVDYDPVYLVAGVHDDEVINYWKGVNYPIMNSFERGLCVLQCKVSKCSCATLTPNLTLSKVCSRCDLWGAFHALEGVSESASLWSSKRRISRSDQLHAS